MNARPGLPRALAEALRHVYGCTLCGWRGALVDCLDAAEHGLLCPHCFATAGRVVSADGRIESVGPRYLRARLRPEGPENDAAGRKPRGPAAARIARRPRPG